MIRLKRVYEKAGAEDGFRILVDRLWPRAVSKEKARVDLWLKEIAPSDALRKWFAHDPKKWDGFRTRYRDELKAKKELVQQLKRLEKERGTLTLLYAARDVKHNNAVALKEILK